MLSTSLLKAAELNEANGRRRRKRRANVELCPEAI
jgi:hypothetical protein